jgi:hypothetical protein
MVIFSLITCFPSLTRHSQTGVKQTRSVSTSTESAQEFLLFLLNGCTTYHPSYITRYFCSAIFLSTHPSRWEHISCQLPNCRYKKSVDCGATCKTVPSSIFLYSMLLSSIICRYKISYIPPTFANAARSIVYPCVATTT